MIPTAVIENVFLVSILKNKMTENTFVVENKNKETESYCITLFVRNACSNDAYCNI